MMCFLPDKKKGLKIPFSTLHKNSNHFKLIFKCFLNLIFWLEQTLDFFSCQNMGIFTSWGGCLLLRHGHVQPFWHMTLYCHCCCILGFNASVHFNWLLPWLQVIFCFLFYLEVTTTVSSTERYFLNSWFLSLLKGQLLIWYARAQALSRTFGDYS